MASASVPPPRAEVLTRETERDPETWAKTFAWLIVTFSLAQVLLFSFGRDQTIYALIGRGILEGEMPYRDLWDFKPPGIFLVYALSFRIFGATMVAPRIIEALVLVAAVLGCRRIGEKLFDSRTGGLLGGAIYTLLHAQLEFWHTGQPESYGGALSILCLGIAIGDWTRKRAPLAWLVLGELYGVLFLLKPTLAAIALPISIYLFLVRRKQGHTLLRQIAPIAWSLIGSLLPIAACVLWFVGRGAFRDLAWTLFEFTPGYTRLGWTERSVFDLYSYGLTESVFLLSYLAGGGVVAAVLLDGRVRAFRGGFALVFGALFAQVVGIAMQAKFFQYHYGATMPLVGLLAGLGYYRLWRKFGVGSFLGTVCVLVLGVSLASLRLPVRDVPHGFWVRSLLRLEFLASWGKSRSREELDRELYLAADYNLDANRQVGLELLRTLPPKTPIFVWGFEPSIYWFSDHPPASRFIYNVPQRAKWKNELARRELMDDLRGKAPSALIVQRNDLFPFVTGDHLDSARSLPTFPELAALLELRYEKTKELEDFSIYLRRTESPEDLKKTP